MTRDTDTDTGEAYPGRRLRCDSCGERFPASTPYSVIAEHGRDCRAPVSHPYQPDRVRDGTQTGITDFSEETVT